MQQMGPISNPRVPVRHVHPWRMALSGVVILAAGITIGVAATMVIVHPADPRPPQVDPNETAMNTILMFRDQLGLTVDQQGKIRKVLSDGFDALNKIRREAQPKIEKALQTTMEDVEKVLTPEQLSDWRKIVQRSLVWRFGRGMGPGFGGFGPDRGGMRGGGRGSWPGGPGGREGEWGRRGFNPGDPNASRGWDGGFRGDPNGPRPWGGFGRGDSNAPRGDRPLGYDRSWMPNDPGRSQRRDGHEPNDFRPGGWPPSGGGPFPR
jgi:hypothetical protein